MFQQFFELCKTRKVSMVLSYNVLCWVGLKIFLYIYNFGDKELVKSLSLFFFSVTWWKWLIAFSTKDAIAYFKNLLQIMRVILKLTQIVSSLSFIQQVSNHSSSSVKLLRTLLCQIFLHTTSFQPFFSFKWQLLFHH